MTHIPLNFLDRICETYAKIIQQEWPSGIPLTEEAAARAVELRLEFDTAASLFLSATELAEYESTLLPAHTEYKLICDKAWIEYDQIYCEARTEYYQVYREGRTKEARTKYIQVCDEAWDKYIEVRGKAWDKYNQVRAITLLTALRNHQ